MLHSLATDFPVLLSSAICCSAFSLLRPLLIRPSHMQLLSRGLISRTNPGHLIGFSRLIYSGKPFRRVQTISGENTFVHSSVDIAISVRVCRKCGSRQVSAFRSTCAFRSSLIKTSSPSNPSGLSNAVLPFNPRYIGCRRKKAKSAISVIRANCLPSQLFLVLPTLCRCCGASWTK